MADRTPWMNARELVQWMEDQHIASPPWAWQAVQILRTHGTKKLVIEKGRPIPGGREEAMITDGNRQPRPVTRYVFRKRVDRGRFCAFRVTVKVLEEGSR